MDEETVRPEPAEIAPGAAVVDSDGKPVGTVRAAYPHYLAVEDPGPPARAFRAPRQAIGSVAGGTVTLTVPTDALDPMTPSAVTPDVLPETGGDPTAAQ